MTPEDIEAEYWAHHYADNAGKHQEEYEDDDFDLEALVQLDDPDAWEDLIGGE